MRFNISIKRKCPVCKKKVENYNNHLEKEHKEVYFGKRAKLLGRIETFNKLLPYLAFIYITISFFYLDFVADLIIIPIIIIGVILLRKKIKSIIMESFVMILDEYQSLKKKVSEEEKKSKEKDVKSTLDDTIKTLFNVFNGSYLEDFIVSRAKSILQDKKYENLNIIKGVDEKLKSNLNKIIDRIENHLDNEELELIKFLESKRQYNYSFWIILQTIVITSAIIFSILTNIIEGGIFLFFIILLIMTIFNDVQNRINKTFNKGHYRFTKNKKLLKDFENYLGLVLNNSHIRGLEEYPCYNQSYSLIKDRSDNYSQKISPYIDYFKRFEFIAILGITISYFYPLFQPSVMIEFLSNHWLDLLISILLILGVFIQPYFSRRKDETIIKVHSELRDELKESIGIINYCLMIYNLDLSDSQ